MTVRFPCVNCTNKLVRIIRRGLATCDIQCTGCGHIRTIEKIRIKLLERQQEKP